MNLSQIISLVGKKIEEEIGYPVGLREDVEAIKKGLKHTIVLNHCLPVASYLKPVFKRICFTTYLRYISDQIYLELWYVYEHNNGFNRICVKWVYEGGIWVKS